LVQHRKAAADPANDPNDAYAVVPTPAELGEPTDNAAKRQIELWGYRNDIGIAQMPS